MEKNTARLVGLAGIAIISFSAIFVRLADVSPTTAAFFRAAYAWPVLFVLARLVRNQDRRDSRARWMAFGSGLRCSNSPGRLTKSNRAVKAELTGMSRVSTILVSPAPPKGC